MKNSKKLIMNTGFLPINYKIIQELGVEVGMLLCLLIDKQELFNKVFYYTAQSVEKEIKMNKKVFMKSKKILVEMGLVKSWNGEGNKSYFNFDDDTYKKLEELLGLQKSQIDTTEVPNEYHRSPKMVLQKSQIHTTEVPKWDLNNNKEQEQIIKTKNNNKEEEQINNNIENLVEEDELDSYLSGNKTFKMEPIIQKPKNSVFSNIEI